MATMEILTYPNKFLSQPTQPVKNIDGELQNMIERMAVTMYQAPGIGLAAIQVGINQSFPHLRCLTPRLGTIFTGPG